MARKLKSDNVLFIATILLVALSLVMVYSASAPIAMSRYGQASFFLIKQAMWAALGLPMLWLLMKVDYRTYREPVFIWTGLGLVDPGAGRRAVQRAGQQRAPLVRPRRHRRPAVGVREALEHRLHRGDS